MALLRREGKDRGRGHVAGVTWAQADAASVGNGRKREKLKFRQSSPRKGTPVSTSWSSLSE